MTSWGVRERKEWKVKQREQKRDTSQHPVVTERKGGKGTDQLCVNGISYRQK